MIGKDIKSSYVCARRYVERCCIEVEQDGQVIQAFTEREGKNRVTDWGGTSSALSMLHKIGNSGSSNIVSKIERAPEWLLADQKEDGSWEAAEMQCCEATSAVLYDLNETGLLTEKITEKALDFIGKCYVERNGYFVSMPDIDQVPHIYTTFLAVRTLSTMSRSITDKWKCDVIEWIKSAVAADGRWNAVPNCVEGDVAHTVFALLTLLYCGVPVVELKKSYKRQIKWLISQIKNCTVLGGAFSYEATEAYSAKGRDSYGDCAYILKSYHFNAALLCTLFLKIGRIGVAQRLIAKIIKLRGIQDGWGLPDGKIFVWATQQAVECMYDYEAKIHSDTFWGTVRSVCFCVPLLGVKILIATILIPTILWLFQDAQKGADIVLSIIVAIIPWLVKRED